MLKRHILMLMFFLLIILRDWVELNLNVAIISMVRPSSQKMNEESKSSVVICPNVTFFWKEDENDSTSEKPISLEGTYDWNDYEKRLILSAYQWLSWLSVLPGSVLAQKYGSKLVVGYASCVSALLSSFVPFAATYGVKGVMYIRMLQGVTSHSCAFAALMVTIVLVGNALGFGCGGYLFGYIGQYLHWKYIFHLTSLYGLVWTVFWYFLVYDYPANHPTISIEEMNKILNNNKTADEKIPTPWKDIFTSVPVYIWFLLQHSLFLNFMVLITFFPLYLKDMFGFDSNQIGIVVSLPHFICVVIVLFGAWLSNHVIRKQWLSVTNTRKLFSCTALFLASASLIVMAFIQCDVTMTISCSILAPILRSIGLIGSLSTMIELSPKFCGIIEGVTATIGEIANFAFVTGISHLTHVLPTPEFWQVVFLSTAAIGFIASTLFLLWGSAETQPWDQGSKKVHSKTAEK